MPEEFIYDQKEDYSPQRNGFLTPVYFDIEVLSHFFYSQKYRITFSSESYILLSWESNTLPLGINKNKKVFAWLGDLKELTKNQKYLFLAHNVASEHDIESEFKHAQLGAMFTNRIKEVEIFLSLYKINDLIKTHFKFKLWNLPETNTLNIIQMCSNYKKVIFNNEDDFKTILSKLNEEIIETFQKSNLKNYLKTNKIGYNKKFGSLKLFNKFLDHNSLNENNLVAPLFYLYDLRIWANHRDGNHYLEEVKSKMGLDEFCSYKEIYNTLIDNLYKNLNELFRMLTMRGLD